MIMLLEGVQEFFENA